MGAPLGRNREQSESQISLKAAAAGSRLCGKLGQERSWPLSLFPSFSCKPTQNKEPTSGLEPLTCSLRVIIRVLPSVAGVCKIRIFKQFSLLRLAVCCTVSRSRWCQSSVNFAGFRISSEQGLNNRRSGLAMQLRECTRSTHCSNTSHALGEPS